MARSIKTASRILGAAGGGAAGGEEGFCMNEFFLSGAKKKGQ